MSAELREGIRPGSGVWFYDCPVCPCDFGPLTRDKDEAQCQAREHDAKHHREDRNHD